MLLLMRVVIRVKISSRPREWVLLILADRTPITPLRKSNVIAFFNGMDAVFILYDDGSEYGLRYMGGPQFHQCHGSPFLDWYRVKV
jgi:hypothetical protein